MVAVLVPCFTRKPRFATVVADFRKALPGGRTLSMKTFAIRTMEDGTRGKGVRINRFGEEEKHEMDEEKCGEE